MPFNHKSPAEYVDFLLRPGLLTTAGPIPLAAYVSTARRSPNAHAVRGFFDQLMRGFSNSALDYTIAEPTSGRRVRTPRAYAGEVNFSAPIIAHDAIADGLNDLEQLREHVMSRGGVVRASNWRRVFSGQGTPENIIEVMNFIVEHRALLAAVVDRTGQSPIARYARLTSGSEMLRAMVRDEVFGLDCLGFVGTYLVWCGIAARYPEWDQLAYITRMHFEAVDELDAIDARCIVMWLDEVDTQHIGFIDAVTSRTDGHIRVNFCQSSRGGPQINVGARLARTDLFFTANGANYRKFNFTQGTPALPVTGHVIVGKRAQW